MMMKKINKKNIICAGIDPGVNIGIAVFSIENVFNNDIKSQNIYAVQKNFTKEIDFINHDIRIEKINSFIYEVLTKYNVDIVCFEQAHYSRGKFSYAENLLARYTGSIYLTIRLLKIQILSMSYKLMQKLLINKSLKGKNKEAILEKVKNIYHKEIKKLHYDKLDALGYGYALYRALYLSRHY
jgi:Holliday junction resolvasome RuvABC endonuclease subunit